jgi:hypothetical protein
MAYEDPPAGVGRLERADRHGDGLGDAHTGAGEDGEEGSVPSSLGSNEAIARRGDAGPGRP